jgi:hypothetical protein
MLNGNLLVQPCQIHPHMQEQKKIHTNSKELVVVMVIASDLHSHQV